jgi:hypothetical protein
MGQDRKRAIAVLLFSLLLVLLLGWLRAEAQAPKDLPDVTLRTTSVAAFKNGLGFFIRQGTARIANGQARIPFVPEASLGSMWLAPNDRGVTIEELVAYRYKLPKERSIDSLDELLQNSVGKTVTVTFNQKDYTGEVLGFSKPEPPTTPSRADPYAASIVPALPGRVLLMKVGDAVLAMDPRSVTLLSGKAMPNMTIKEDSEAKALRFTLKGAGDSANLTMGYLQKGLGWTPSYLISLQDEKTARITMQAVLTDDVEDLTNAQVFFVVGVPNFQFADQWSPMALQQTLMEYMRDAERPVTGRQFSNALTAQSVGGIVQGREAETFEATVGALEGAPEEDLFLYSRPGVTLAKGERATYNIFAANVGYEHIYEWEVTDSPQVDIYGNRVNNSYSNNAADQRMTNVVWHSVRLKNGSGFPWTSAPAMVISGTKALSQDTLLYTPKGGSTNLKMTIATDVRTDKKEVEVERQPKALYRNGNEFEAVTVEGTLKLKSYKSKEIALKVYRSLVGEVISATDAGQTEKLGEGIRGVNPTSRITWDVNLQPGNEKVITYRYKILVRI